MFVLQAAVTQPSLIHKTVLAKSTPLARVWHHIYFHHSSSFITDRRPFIRHSSSPPLFGWLDWFTLLLLPPPKRSYHTEADSTLLITITHAHAATASDTSTTHTYYYDFFRHFGLRTINVLPYVCPSYVPEVRTLESGEFVIYTWRLIDSTWNLISRGVSKSQKQRPVRYLPRGLQRSIFLLSTYLIKYVR